MKKVGIITITGESNFGNRLQNFALQAFIEKNFDVSCDTLINGSNSIKGIIKEIVKPDRGVLSDRQIKFREFNSQYIHFSDITTSNYRTDKRIKRYDILICGSDQIWNSNYPENDKANFGYFYKNQDVISYAASFGANQVKNNKAKRYKKYLNHLLGISVREERGKELVEGLTGRQDVFVHVDPTMLIDKVEWENIEKCPQNFDGKKYVLKYFLGDFDSLLEQQLQDFTKINNYEIIDLLDKKSPFYNIGPAEFLFLEHHAELVITDSFHSSVFAILFNTPFTVVKRNQNDKESMVSRIDTLLGMFNLKDHFYDGEIIAKRYDDMQISKILKIERERSLVYLSNQLRRS